MSSPAQRVVLHNVLSARVCPGCTGRDEERRFVLTLDGAEGNSIRLSAATNDPVVPPSTPLRLMAVHAHPDDESSKGAATMARYAREGVQVMVATLTGGERGDILNKAMERPEVRENLASIRREEMARAREILGVSQEFLGFVDSGLPEGDPLPPLPEGCFALQPLEVAAEPLVRAVREFRPHVILTYDEEGGYPHPDHIKTHEVAVEAFEAAADPDRYPGTGDPWQPLKLYYFATFHKDRITALHEELLRRGLESPYADWFERWEDRAADRKPVDITTRVQCADYFPLRDQALLAHATQIDPQGGWFACPLEVQRAAWPTEDYHLARSVVDTEFPEDDLFDGVRERVSQ
jgi:mycothiol S-conjugate amidase